MSREISGTRGGARLRVRPTAPAAEASEGCAGAGLGRPGSRRLAERESSPAWPPGLYPADASKLQAFPGFQATSSGKREKKKSPPPLADCAEGQGAGFGSKVCEGP